MSLFQNLNKRVESELQDIKAETKQVDISELQSNIETIFGLGITPKRKIKDFLSSGVGWVYACIDAIANEIAGIELKLFQQNGDDIDEVKNHEILDLLARANSVTTKFDLFYLTQQYLDLAGEAPWFLEFQNGKPVNIFLLRPDRLTVKPPTKEGELIGGYTYQVFKDGMKEIFLEPFEVLFLKYPDPVKPFRGKGTLEAAVVTFDIDETAEKFNLKFFNNSATPNSVLSTDKKLSKEVIRKLKHEIENKHEGFENAHKTMVLEGGLKWESMALSHREMDFIESMKFTRDKILAIFRVPKSVLGLTEDVNRANAEAGDFVFAKRTIKPKMQKLVEMLNEFLVPFFDDSGTLFLDFTDPVPENEEQKLKVASEGVTKGVLTINEARELLGYDPVEGGDDVLAPSTPQVPAERIAGAGKGKKPKKRARVFNQTYLRSNRKRSQKKRMTDALKKVVGKQVAKTVSSVIYSQLLTKAEVKKRFKNRIANAKKAFKGTKAEKQTFQDDQLRVAAEFEDKFRREMASIFRIQRDIIIGKLPNKADNRLLNVEEQTEATVARTRSIVALIIGVQSAKTFQLLGQGNKLTERNNDPTAKYLEDKVFKFSTDITVETNRLVAKTLDSAVAEGLSIPQTTTKIQNLFSGMQKNRAQKIARSEIIRATSFATEEAFIVSEVVELKEWLTFIDERTDAECISMNGKRLSLGGDYFKKGDQIGTIPLDYENIAGPPLHSNCRCTLVPVVVA